MVKRIAEETGMNYDVLIGGDYKILLEQIAYFTFQGAFIAMTATEAAMYDQQVNGLLLSWMQSLRIKIYPCNVFGNSRSCRASIVLFIKRRNKRATSLKFLGTTPRVMIKVRM